MLKETNWNDGTGGDETIRFGLTIESGEAGSLGPLKNLKTDVKIVNNR